MSQIRTGTPDCERAQAQSGVAFGIAAYLWWGFVAIYFKAVAHVPALEVLAHRVLWSVPLLHLLLVVTRQWRGVFATLRQGHTALTLIATTALIAINWLVFIWAIANDRVIEASLGYYINPLVSVFLGFVFLQERLRPRQWLSVALAGVGVIAMTISHGSLPWVSLVLAGSFGTYGLLRKTVRAGALTGLTVETTILLPLAMGYAVTMAARGQASFRAVSSSTDVLLMLAGIITIVPLLCFTRAARRLRLSTMGFMQYLAPSCQLLLAVIVFHEPFTRTHLITFVFIWTALSIYTVDTVMALRRAR